MLNQKKTFKKTPPLTMLIYKLQITEQLVGMGERSLLSRYVKHKMRAISLAKSSPAETLPTLETKT